MPLEVLSSSWTEEFNIASNVSCPSWFDMPNRSVQSNLPMRSPMGLATMTGDTERLLSVCLNTATGPVNFLSSYAPTLDSSDDSRNQFYEQLDQLKKGCLKEESLFLLGDLNVRVGADHDAWTTCLGHHGTGRMNDNEQRLLELCSYHSV
ncbi:hypothetical protein Bbelb_314130 [Branchiostoma belcheri]|nr:hypothetical protein Bbelb_314130 [Branchiostoma belcheri]